MGFTSCISAKFKLCVVENKLIITIILMTRVSHREWENAHTHARTDFMDARGCRISCSIQILCLITIHSIIKCSTELYMQQVTALFSDTAECIHRDLWKDYESFSVTWNSSFTVLSCQFHLSCYDHWRFLHWTFLALIFWLKKFSLRYPVTAF